MERQRKRNRPGGSLTALELTVQRAVNDIRPGKKFWVEELAQESKNGSLENLCGKLP